MLGAPDLDVVPQMRPHEGRAEGDSHLLHPAGHFSSEGTQDTIGLSGCRYTLLAHVKFFINQDTQVLLSIATLKEFFSQFVYISGVTSNQM